VRRRRVGNLLGLGVLALLMPGEAMHPYQMAHVLRRTGKSGDSAIKMGSLYTVIQNLERHGLILAVGSERSGRRPERTNYAITDAGRAELGDWLRELVAVPEEEHPRFEAALSVLSVLPPGEATALLTERAAALEHDVAERRETLERHRADTRRLFLIEAEYMLAMRAAELAWVRDLLAELTDGTFPDLTAWREFHELGRVGPEFTEMVAEGEMPTD
jgi:DNA-binding PadR family transcriptional regulator